MFMECHTKRSKNQNKKKDAWKEIYSHIGVDVDIVKKKMKSLLAQYRRVRRRVSDAKKSGSVADAKKSGSGADAKKSGSGADAKKSGSGADAKKSGSGADAKKSGSGADDIKVPKSLLIKGSYFLMGSTSQKKPKNRR
jgi:hypothetical protein